MILWCDGGHSARENMRRDATLLERLEGSDARELAEPVLRLFAFSPPGITLGRAQRPETSLDLARCRDAGIEWAVRPTGGRAIYHADEWTYAFAARLDDPDWGGSLRDTYARVSALIAASLRDLGIPVEVAGAGAGRVEIARGAAARPACFASTLTHEITLAGRKVVGSAQRRGAVAFLQQGSVLLSDGHLRLAEFLALDSAGRTSGRAALERNSALARPYLGGDERLERWAAALEVRLGSRARRFDGASGAWLLTLSERHPYTAAAS